MLRYIAQVNGVTALSRWVSVESERRLQRLSACDACGSDVAAAGMSYKLRRQSYHERIRVARTALLQLH